MKAFSAKTICDRVSGRLSGTADLEITGVEQVERAKTGQITFIGSRQYAELWPQSQASAALIQNSLSIEPGPGRALVHVRDCDLALATVLEMFAPPPPSPPVGVDPRAVVDAKATLGKNTAVGAMSFIGPGTRIGDGTIIHPNVTILADCAIGARCVFWPGVVIRERCIIGDGCILHPNVSIGSDGFGYRPAPDGRSLVKIPQIGIVRLGNAVEIGAGTCIDRGKFSETSIGDGTKIDNLCQIGHNCRIGRCVIMAGLIGVGGSATIGDGAMIGGGSSIKDHITVGAGAKVAGCSGVMNDVPAGASWFGFVAQDARAGLREVAAVRKLPDLLRAMKQHEQADS